MNQIPIAVGCMLVGEILVYHLSDICRELPQQSSPDEMPYPEIHFLQITGFGRNREVSSEDFLTPKDRNPGKAMLPVG